MDRLTLPCLENHESAKLFIKVFISNTLNKYTYLHVIKRLNLSPSPSDKRETNVHRKINLQCERTE
jgi:hypothetical protein